MESGRQNPAMPQGVDDDEYKRIRALMRASVLNVWRVNEVIAGMDPFDVVDEAWGSMAINDFTSKGPFLPHALAVARNKAIDHLRRAEARRRGPSIDTPLGGEGTSTLADTMAGSAGADEDYFEDLERVATIRRLALAEEAIYTEGVLTAAERQAFVGVRVHGKSRAAVGRELDPPLTGQRVGQIVAQALMKVQLYVRERGGSGE